ncbi:MAG: restriction endonuclease subunit S [Candidatus Accumulibacter sp.]|jgi:type I restriction enzyme S subunit|nr:restriction endonuclease subunit S [Accumulibacter sp.]
MVKGCYKTTELGLVPSDWDVLTLRGNFDFFQNNTYARDCLNPSKGDVQNIHYGDVLIKFGSILDCDKEHIPYINPDIRVNLVKRLVQSGDIIIADTAEDNTVGKATEVINVGKKGIVAGLHTVFIRPRSGLFTERFLGYFINSSVYHDQLLPFIVGTKVSSVSKGSLQETFVLRPPLPEQRAIAAALSDIDGYIVVIAKKRNIKKGAMQELLTGKRRLPGFVGEWVTSNLAANSTLKARIGWQGLTTAEYLDEGYSYLITGTDFENGKIAWSTCHFVDKHRYDQDTNIQIVNGDVLITKDGTIGKVAIVNNLNRKATLNRGVFVLRQKTNAYDSRYVYYILLSQTFTDFLDKLAAGSTINHLYQKDFVTFEFEVPPTTEEQSAIAAILSDMDAEIDALTAKLTKVRGIKQGMMQELLTGHIRLVDEAGDTASAEKPVAKIIEMPKRKPEAVTSQTVGHNQQFDDAVMIAGIVNALYSDKYPLGRKKVQKCLYLLRRHQDESTAAFKKKAAGPYADEVRYKGGEPIARNAKYITTTAGKQGTAFARGKDIDKALGYIQNWGRQTDIKWLTDKLKFKKIDELELLATVDMAICDLEKSGTPVSVAAIKHLIATNAEWKAKLEKQTFSDANIAKAIEELRTLL